MTTAGLLEVRRKTSRNVAGLCGNVYILVLHDNSGIFSGEKKVEILPVYAAECGLVKVETEKEKSNTDYV